MDGASAEAPPAAPEGAAGAAGAPPGRASPRSRIAELSGQYKKSLTSEPLSGALEKVDVRAKLYAVCTDGVEPK